MRDRKRIEEALGADQKIGSLTSDLDICHSPLMTPNG